MSKPSKTEQLTVHGKRAVAYISESAFAEGRGHRVAFVLENDPGYWLTGGGKVAPWYWGHPTDEKESLRLAQAQAREYNARGGFSDADVDQIIASSMRAARSLKCN